LDIITCHNRRSKTEAENYWTIQQNRAQANNIPVSSSVQPEPEVALQVALRDQSATDPLSQSDPLPYVSFPTVTHKPLQVAAPNQSLEPSTQRSRRVNR
jgi:hypothetical protein